MERWKKKIWAYLPSRWISCRKRRLKAYMAVSEDELNRHLRLQIEKEIRVAALLLGVLCLCVAAACISAVSEKETAVIERNAAGEGDSEETITVDVGEEEFEYEVVIAEEQLTRKEREALFEEGFAYLEKEMLNGNASLDEVRHDLVLLWEIPDYPLEIHWETEDDTRIDLEGKVYNKDITEGSELVHIKATLTYQTYEREKEYAVSIFPRRISASQELAERVLEEMKEIEKNSRTGSSLEIPLTMEEARIRIGREPNRWIAVSGIVLVLIVLLAARQWESESRRLQEVRQASQLEYSNILWQFVLFLEAGFTIPKAWEKIVADYEHKKEQIPEERRFVYEQMACACRQMELGYPLEEVFRMFSGKMGLRSYAKLMTLFLQNITKGSKHMLDILKTEEQQAFVVRCEQAKRMGEEADTKLLLPMGMMLLNILLLLMVPAYLQF